MIQKRFLLALDGGSQLERNADARHFRDRLRLVLPVRVDERNGLRQFGFALVVVGDDQIDAKLPAQRGLVIGRDAAVDRHDQLYALLFERVDGDGVQPVALFKAGRDIAGHMAALAAQILRQQAGRRDAVDVVIAEDGDMLAPGKRLFDAGGSLVHVQKGKRRRERIAAG